MIGNREFYSYIWESLFLYLHPVMGVDFHPHFYHMLPIAGVFYIESFVVRGIMNESREA